MAAHRVPLKIDQGATFRKIITWSSGEPPVPVDLTGCTARLQGRATVESPTALFELTTTNGGLALGGVAGTITVLITATQSSAWAWTDAVYDLEIVFPGGDVRRLTYGPVCVSPEVTR
jgi:hypothetical protein